MLEALECIGTPSITKKQSKRAENSNIILYKYLKSGFTCVAPKESFQRKRSSEIDFLPIRK